MPPNQCRGCILLDVKMPDLDGIQVQSRLLKLRINLPIVFLTGHGDVATSVQAIKAGAEDYLSKPVKKADLFDAIQCALLRYDDVHQRDSQLSAFRSLVATLTPREREVFTWVVRGKLNKQIAHELGTSERTIKAHRHAMMLKLRIDQVADAVLIAVRLGLITEARRKAMYSRFDLMTYLGFVSTGNSLSRAFARSLLILVFVGILPTMSVAAEPLPRSVLILDQSEPNSRWGLGFRGALSATLNTDAAPPVAIYSEILDLGRFSGKDYEALLRTSLREKYRNKAIGVIVVHGATALELFLRMRPELWPDVPVVFGVVDEASAARLQAVPNVTGTILRYRLSNMIATARMIVPNLKRIALVGDPLERQTFRKHYAEELPQISKEFEIIDLSGLPVTEIKQRVAVLPQDAAILYTAIYVDGAGVSYIPPEPLMEIAKAANRPIVGDAEPRLDSVPQVALWWSPSQAGRPPRGSPYGFSMAKKSPTFPLWLATSENRYSTGGNCSASASAKTDCLWEARSVFGNPLSGAIISGSS